MKIGGFATSQLYFQINLQWPIFVDELGGNAHTFWTSGSSPSPLNSSCTFQWLGVVNKQSHNRGGGVNKQSHSGGVNKQSHSQFT